jgi:hypothetical protein
MGRWVFNAADPREIQKFHSMTAALPTSNLAERGAAIHLRNVQWNSPPRRRWEDWLEASPITGL